MAKPILIVNGATNGYGDMLFALKLLGHLREKFISAGEVPPPIYIVTDHDAKTKIKLLGGDAEFNASILTPDELENRVTGRHMSVGAIIYGPTFSDNLLEKVDKVLPVKPEQTPIPLIIAPEYGFFHTDESIKGMLERFDKLTHQVTVKIINSGFNRKRDEQGILLSNELLNRPSDEVLVGQLDEKLRHCLFQEANSLQSLNTELSLQYSHDTYVRNPDELDPSSRFLHTHCALIKGNNKNQAVVMVGSNVNLESKKNKFNALDSLKEKLISQGFTRIVFQDVGNNQEPANVLYDSETVPCKEYRVLYVPSMSHRSMIACCALSGLLIGTTGDQSLGEAVSANKIMIYEALGHKIDFKEHYYLALKEEAGNNQRVQRAIDLLEQASNEEDCQELGDLLREPPIQDELQRICQIVREKYDLVPVLFDALSSETKITHEIIEQLTKGSSQKALEILNAQEGTMTIYDEWNGRCLLDFADQTSIFYQELSDPNQLERQRHQHFINLVDRGEKDRAIGFLEKYNIDLLSEFEGKTILETISILDCNLTIKEIINTQLMDLLTQGRQDKALALFQHAEKLFHANGKVLSIFDDFFGKNFIQYAEENSLDGEFAKWGNTPAVKHQQMAYHLISLADSNQITEAIALLQKEKFDFFAPFPFKIRTTVGLEDASIGKFFRNFGVKNTDKINHIFIAQLIDLVQKNEREDALSLAKKIDNFEHNFSQYVKKYNPSLESRDKVSRFWLEYLLKNSYYNDAFKFFLNQKNEGYNIDILDKFFGKSILKWVREGNSNATLLFNQYLLENKESIFLHYRERNQPDEAFELIIETKMPINAGEIRSLFENAVLGRHFETVIKMINYPDFKNSMSEFWKILQQKSSSGEVFFSEMRREYNSSQDPSFLQATRSLIQKSLEEYTPTNYKRKKMHETLVNSLTNEPFSEENMINVLKETRDSIRSEYHYINPQKGLLFGSRLYSTCVNLINYLEGDSAKKNLKKELSKLHENTEGRADSSKNNI